VWERYRISEKVGARHNYKWKEMVKCAFDTGSLSMENDDDDDDTKLDIGLLLWKCRIHRPITGVPQL